jgi:thymidylate kinase
MNKNPFYVIEGPDGSGKSALATALAEHFGAYKFDTPSNACQMPDGQELENYYAKLMTKFEGVISDYLKTQPVVSSRSGYSIPPLIAAYENRVIGVPSMQVVPDHIIYLQVPYDTLRKRLMARGIDKLQPHERDEEMFTRLVSTYETQMSSISQCLRLDGTQSVDSLVQDILSQTTPHLRM